MQEDGSLILNLQALVSDADGDPLTLSVSNPQSGSLLKNADGSYTYMPGVNFNGEDAFTLTAGDGTPHANSSLSNTVRLTIIAVNDIAVAVNDIAVTDQHKAVIIPVLANDSDIDNSTGTNVGLGLSANAGLIVRIIANPAHGTVMQNDDGNLTYTPDAGFYGTDSFTYLVNDGQDNMEGVDSNLASVTITVNPINRPPFADDDDAILNEGASICLSLLSNDSDADGDILAIMLESQPAHGQLMLNADNTVIYTPLGNYSGEDSFSYRLGDGQALSGIATVRLMVSPVADAPILVLTDINDNSSHEVFRTSWENAVRKEKTSTLTKQSELEGWTLIIHPDNTSKGNNGFEIWRSGDKMPKTGGKPYTMNAAEGNGANWLEINRATSSTRQTFGIERKIQTVAGASYSLSLDLAGSIGYSTDYTRLGIYVDGQKIGAWAGTSSGIELNWQTFVLQFTGSGQLQAIKIISEAAQYDVQGRGVMIDDIVLRETFPANTGLEDSAIRLSAISAALTDTDGSETLTLTIGSLPIGATLTDGAHSFTASPESTTADITDWELANLSLTPAKDFNGSFSLKVAVTSKEQANGDQTSTFANLDVTVLPVNDAPVAKAASYTLQEDGNVQIDFASLISDVDGDILTLGYTNPKGGVLKKNDDGSYNYAPRYGFKGADSFSYTISDGLQSATATISLEISKKPDDEGDDGCGHHDSGHHNGFEHSGHKGYQDLDERGASLLLQSNVRGKGRDEDKGNGFVVANQGKVSVADTFKLDWQGSVVDREKPNNDDGWMVEYLAGKETKQRNLAEITGLKVKL